MKYFVVILFATMLLFNPAFAQETANPSLIVYNEEVPYYDFNRVARDTVIMELGDIHEISWQVTLNNDLMYANPDGNAVVRFYDVSGPETFLEIGMGSPPDHKFWIAAQLPDVGYVVIHDMLDRGWTPDAKLTVSYTDRAGMTVNNGLRIVVSNLDIGVFAIDSYSVHGMESSTDPPAVNTGSLKMEFLSGDPGESIYHLFPFYVTAVVAAIVGILFLTKKRS
ncbi:MAG: conserved exported protein of unknown function [Nitrosopumilales archaeon]|nr:MAG: conserved exported protein of unknown function [Nitrosopumilales archaeon]